MLQFNERVIVQFLGHLTVFAIAERFTPVANSDAMSHLSEQIPQLAPLLSAEAQARLRETLRRAGASERADPRLEALSRQW
jgi:hypothetical protein